MALNIEPLEMRPWERRILLRPIPGRKRLAKRVKRQKVDPIAREFFEPEEGDGASAAPVSSIIEGLLAPLLVPRVAEPAFMVG